MTGKNDPGTSGGGKPPRPTTGSTGAPRERSRRRTDGSPGRTEASLTAARAALCRVQANRFHLTWTRRRTGDGSKRNPPENRTSGRRSEQSGRPQETSNDDKPDSDGSRDRRGHPRGRHSVRSSGGRPQSSASQEPRRRMPGPLGGRCGVPGFKHKQHEFSYIPYEISTSNPKGNPQHNPGTERQKETSNKLVKTRNPSLNNQGEKSYGRPQTA